MYSYKSEVVKETPFPTLKPPPLLPVLFPLVMFRKLHNFSKIVTEAPFAQHSLQDFPSPALFLFVMTEIPGDLIKPSSGLQN